MSGDPIGELAAQVERLSDYLWQAVTLAQEAGNPDLARRWELAVIEARGLLSDLDAAERLGKVRGAAREKLLTTTEAGQRLGVTPITVATWARRGAFPNAQQVGAAGWWIIPESDLAEARARPWAVRLQREAYEAAGLQVLGYWARQPPRLRCLTCGETWRSWDWRCPTGCNAEANPDRRLVANPELRDARQAQGLSQKALAEAVGVTQTAVCQWEARGTRPGEPETLRRAIKVLGVNPWPDLAPEDLIVTRTPAARRLIEARQALGYETAADFGREVGVNPATARDWEGRGKIPYPKNRRRVVELLGFDPWEGSGDH